MNGKGYAKWEPTLANSNLVLEAFLIPNCKIEITILAELSTNPQKSLRQSADNIANEKSK